MTQEEKDLLLKDLCARLPYGVKINFTNPSNERDVVEKLRDVEFRGEDVLLSTTTWNNVKIDECKPYLRPMSSMTEEEKKTLNNILEYQYCSDDSCMCESTDWLNEHHFDYRGLIGKGLALPAKENMYND